MKSSRHAALDLGKELRTHGRDNLVFRVCLRTGDGQSQEAAALFASPRLIELPRVSASCKVVSAEGGIAVLEFNTPAYLHRFWFEFGELMFRASDNCFDLFPGRPRRIEVRFDREVTADLLQQKIEMRSLADTYL